MENVTYLRHEKYRWFGIATHVPSLTGQSKDRNRHRLLIVKDYYPELTLEKGLGLAYFDYIYFDPNLESIRKEQAFKDLMEKHFPGQVYEGEQAINSSEPIYFKENCLLLADFYESEGEGERAKWLREKAKSMNNE